MAYRSAISRRRVLGHAKTVSVLATLGGCGGRQAGEAPSDLADLDAVGLAARISAGEISAEESVLAAIDRAEKADTAINAIVTTDYEAARSRANKHLSGPFAGVPSFVKDLTDVTAKPTRFGSRAFSNHVAESQTPFVDEFFGLGLVSLGKSATPEFGLTATTEPLSDGPTRNPWNTDRSVGGSSGGAAALVAARVVPIAHASDGGGSIRIPASCCGLVGLKSSRGRLPRSWREESPIMLSVHGIESRTVRDTAAFFAAMEMPSAESGLEPIGTVSGPAAKRLKIGVFTDGAAGGPVHPDVIATIQSAAKLCADAGHEVTEIAAPFDSSINDDFLLYWGGGAFDAIRAWEESQGKTAGEADFEPLTYGLARHYEANRGFYDGAVARLRQVPEFYASVFGDLDILLSPVLSAPPPPIGYLRPDIDYETALTRVVAYAQFTGFHNVAGAPAISLPIGVSSEGLPIGAQFSARNGKERMLLELAYELEEAVRWDLRKPETFI